MSRWMTVIAVCALLCAVCSCGGGGGGASEALFSGFYCFLYMEAGGLSAWGEAQPDGAGNVLIGGSQNAVGTISPFTPPPLTYTIAGDRTFRLFDGPTELARGGIAADGSSVVISTSAAGIPPFLFVMLRYGGTFTPASFSGLYHWGWWRTDGGPVSLFGGVTFDGMGGFSGTVGVNEGGTIDGGPVTGMNDLGVDGTGSLTDFTGHESPGCLLDGGDIAAYAGGDTAGNDPMLQVLLRAGSGMDEAAFSGAYWVVGFEDGGGGPTSIQGTITANGAGTASITATGTDGTSLSPVTGSASYTVAGDGMMVLNRGGVPGTEDLTGAVSPDGSYAFLSGGSVGGSSTVFYVLLRK